MPRTPRFVKSISRLESCCAAETQDELDEMCFFAKTTFMHRPLKTAGPKSTLGRKTTRSNESGEALPSTLSHRPSKDTKKKKHLSLSPSTRRSRETHASSNEATLYAFPPASPSPPPLPLPLPLEDAALFFVSVGLLLPPPPLLRPLPKLLLRLRWPGRLAWKPAW